MGRDKYVCVKRDDGCGGAPGGLAGLFGMVVFMAIRRPRGGIGGALAVRCRMLFCASRLMVAALLLSAVGCSSDAAKEPSIVFEPEPFKDLPVDEEGKRVLIDAPSGGDRIRVRADETLRDPVTAKGGCLHEVIGCIEGGRVKDDAAVTRCVSAAPSCDGERPWEAAERCCPSACRDAYLTAASSEGARAAFLAHIADGRECYPGLATFLDGGAP